MNSTIMLASGRVLEVDAEFSPGCPQTRTDPGEDAGFDVGGVWEHGEPVDTTEEEDEEIIAELWHQRLEAEDDDRACRDEDYDARADQERTERNRP